MEKEMDDYKKAYFENEYNANKNMAYALVFSAIVLALIWLGYIMRWFVVTDETLLLTNITIPSSLIILLSPIFLIRTKYIRKSGFKYFVLSSFLLVMIILNIVMPKHLMIGWALIIVLTNHYYNPKVGRIMFGIVVVAMLLCIYAGMFLGEYDPNLLMGELDEKTNLIHNFRFSETFFDSPAGRLEYLHKLKVDYGINRYVSVFFFYYLSRVSLITILFFVSNALNKRTYRLLVDEIKVNSVHQKTRTELDVAKEIQIHTLPKEFVMGNDVEIQAELKAAAEVGGDFYDYIKLDEDHVAVVIGDVSGKGIPAAMFMMKTITCFKNYISVDKKPSLILQDVNNQLIEGNDQSMFVTAFLGILNLRTGEFNYANAGHNKPLIGKDNDYHYLNCKSGFVLGALKNIPLKDEVITLKKGDLITLYTDGITEARNDLGEFFGESRLLDFYNNNHFSCLIELHKELKEYIQTFVNGETQSDDITYLTLKYQGEESVFEQMNTTATKESVLELLDFLRDFGTKNKLDSKFVNQLSVVGDELFSNIVKYAYKDNNGDLYVRQFYNLETKEYVLTIVDHGIEFNPFDEERKPVSYNKELKEGGLGILIVRNLVDEYTYDRINGKNVIVLKKMV
ncbi:MAG: SpoIIE family protein phosphatase [Acholeplasmatales bacterium]|nr:SpoIIE family protein phosphatase [Acholeplasmatales bacterium]